MSVPHADARQGLGYASVRGVVVAPPHTATRLRRASDENEHAESVRLWFIASRVLIVDVDVTDAAMTHVGRNAAPCPVPGFSLVKFALLEDASAPCSMLELFSSDVSLVRVMRRGRGPRWEYIRYVYQYQVSGQSWNQEATTRSLGPRPLL